ncbi:MAG: Rrf2 family transcriptional regulator [Deltaproteobacteria bacterium]|nr:Rrf2 family transcriptional regulator [Deltaproteobacteria bacterium]
MRKPKKEPNALLSQTARYALRIVAELARREASSPVRAADLLQTTAIPEHYLSKVLRRLVEHGVLSSQRGHHGGFVLARRPDQVSVAEVLRAVEALPGSACVFGWGPCDESAPCPLHGTWQDLNDAFVKWANNAHFGSDQLSG